MVIAATSTGVQLHRFSQRRGAEPPPLAQWRCNLTGLSQLHNLYFVASRSQIHVYIPVYPSQSISNKPNLIFNSQPSSPRLTGFIDQRNPHAINNLIVQFLGNEEVVAVVRDDGDVDAFLVRHVVQALARREEPSSDLKVEAAEIRPFFQANVGRSAWGLAIHAQARILATSSNLCEVRIFKFGLLQEDSDSDSDSIVNSHNSPPSPHNNTENDLLNTMERRTDTTHHVVHGSANIPHVAFCNTPDDPTGRWLLTTDISGDCRLIDVHTLNIVQKFRFNSFPFHANAGAFDKLNAGWLVMFLDRRGFGEEADVEVALGLEKGEELQHYRVGDGVWDLSRTVGRLPESGEAFVWHREKKNARALESEEMRASEEDTGVGDDVSSEGEHSEPDSYVQSDWEDSDDGGAQIEIDVDLPGGEEDGASGEAPGIESSMLGNAAFDGAIHNHSHEAESIAQPAPPSDSESIESEESGSSSSSYPDLILVDDGEDPDDEMTEDTIPFTSWYNGTSISANKPQFTYPTPRPTDSSNDAPSNSTSDSGTLPPILHTSPHNVYLLQPQEIPPNPSSPSATQSHPTPMIGLANPLRQSIQQDFEYLRRFARLNMYASIPELGLVVLASQKGRALITSLTRIPKGAAYPPHMLPSAPRPGSSGDTPKGRKTKSPKTAASSGAGREKETPVWTEKTVYAMRVECIIPFVQQERRNLRPFAPLVGIAAGPLQGCEGADVGVNGKMGGKGRRWRVMLHYLDHSVLSYEIGRKGSGAGDEEVGVGVDVEGIVV